MAFWNEATSVDAFLNKANFEKLFEWSHSENQLECFFLTDAYLLWMILHSFKSVLLCWPLINGTNDYQHGVTHDILEACQWEGPHSSTIAVNIPKQNTHI